jgi:hypothetical protein
MGWGRTVGKNRRSAADTPDLADLQQREHYTYLPIGINPYCGRCQALP